MNDRHLPEGNAIVYCQGCFNTTYGKTAHGLVRFTKRYRILGVIDERYAGGDAGDILDGRNCGIPLFRSLAHGLQAVAEKGLRLTHFIIGLAPDGGRLDAAGRMAVQEALAHGLNVDAGLHDFLSEQKQ